MKSWYSIFMCLTVTTLTSCSGWQLRGVVDGEAVSYTAYVSFSRADRVGRAMPAALRSRGFELVASKQEADFSVNILNEQFRRRVVSIDPASGYVRELELNLNCEIVVRDKNGLLVVPRQTLKLNRDYYFDELSAEFTTNQRETLERDLASEAATSIVLRLDPGKPEKSD